MASFIKPLAYIILGLTASVRACEDGSCPVDSELSDKEDVSLIQQSKAVTALTQDRVIGAHVSAPEEEDTRHLQNFHSTSYNRYPAIFSSLKELIDKDTAGRKAKLLSFGCSYGAECHSLRQYFPDAQIHGVDIDDLVIQKAIANNSDPLISFFNDTAQLDTESYDAVLAMGVLCHQGLSRTNYLTPEKYSGAVGIIDRLVRPGGYMVIYNADHTFETYSRHTSFANICYEDAASNMAHNVVSTADTLYIRNIEMKLGDNPLNRGMCSVKNKFCIESGWVPKRDAAGNVIQDYVSDDESFGCQFPGTFFQKLKSIDQV